MHNIVSEDGVQLGFDRQNGTDGNGGEDTEQARKRKAQWRNGEELWAKELGWSFGSAVLAKISMGLYERVFRFGFGGCDRKVFNS